MLKDIWVILRTILCVKKFFLKNKRNIQFLKLKDCIKKKKKEANVLLNEVISNQE